MTTPVAALVLAGSRPGGDPLLASSGLTSKALLPIAGVPMLARVLAALQSEGLGIVDVSTREADLEDVFLNLTRASGTDG